MAARFVFRQVYTPDIRIFACDGEIRAKNHGLPQACHQTSYIELVERRGTDEFSMPCGGVVNDYVPFYFSPFTAFAYTIFRGNVNLRCPNGSVLGVASQNDRSFIVYRAADLIVDENLLTYFSNTALNNKSIEIKFGSDLEELKGIVDWRLFDEPPIAGAIAEVGYDGCCRYFKSRADPEHHQDRSSRRMAEFLVKNSVPLDKAACVITPSLPKKAEVDSIFQDYGISLPVFCNPGCFF